MPIYVYIRTRGLIHDARIRVLTPKCILRRGRPIRHACISPADTQTRVCTHGERRARRQIMPRIRRCKMLPVVVSVRPSPTAHQKLRAFRDRIVSKQ